MPSRSAGSSPFAQAAFRQAFAGGRTLDDADNVLIAAAACEMHPSAVLKGAELRSVGEQLSAVTVAAAAAGVDDVPAVRVGDARISRRARPGGGGGLRGERGQDHDDLAKHTHATPVAAGIAVAAATRRAP